MKPHALPLLLLAALALASCGKNEVGTAGLGEACVRNADCAAPFVCANGKCSQAEAFQCTPDQVRCDGDVLQTCDSVTGQFVDKETCTTGCTAGACRPPACEAGATQCNNGVVERCNPSGTGWAFLQYCVYGCVTADGASCKTPACDARDTRCDSTNPTRRLVCDPATGFRSEDCAANGSGKTCSDGECVTRLCVPDSSRCLGDTVTRCDPSGLEFVPETICAFGCDSSTGAAACLPAACDAGEVACDGDALTKCTPDRREFGFVQYCQAGCDSAASPPACRTCSCAALTRRCTVDPASGAPVVEQCRADCSGWLAVEQCPQACATGACVTSDAGCTPGERRCNGRETELCVRLSTGVTEWRFEQRCLGACLGTDCDGTGSCGCTGNLATGERCGTTARPALHLMAMLPSLADGTVTVTPTADSGKSSVLFHTDPIVGSDGVPVPDGTLVTFVHDGTDNLFVSLDADPSRAGLQRPTASGRARVVLKSPTAAREVVVTASLGGRCSESRSLRFIAPAVGPRTVYVADDFSTSRLFDRSQNLLQVAQWDTTNGRVLAKAALDLGTGADGDLVVPANTQRDLAADGLARAFKVTSVGVAEALVDATPNGIGPGDEVLLINVLGASAGLTGVYETKRVARVETGRIVFTENVRNLYGPVWNGDLGTSKVFLQRVPQFGNVTVETQATLRATGYANGGSGVLFFRARGTVRVTGTITMAQAGLPLATQLNVTTPPHSMARLFVGGGGTALSGGGVIVISARTLSLRTETGSTSVGEVRADSSGTGAGGGGSIWLSAGALNVGQGRVSALGANTTLEGRIRLDYDLTQDAGISTAPSPSDTGQRGPYVAVSLPAYVEDPSSGLLLRAPRLFGVIGGTGGISAGLPVNLSGVNIDVSADTTLVWKPLNSGGGPTETFAAPGRSFRFRVRLDTLSDDTVAVYGVAFSVTAGN